MEGADESACDEEGRSSLYWAANYGLEDVVDYLADESEVLDIQVIGKANKTIYKC